MNWALWLFRLALRLYPRSFRERFGEEMEEVFRAGVEDARARGGARRFVLREALRLPASLSAVYLWTLRQGQLTLSGAGISMGAGAPRARWGETFMAGLPHLLIGSFMIIGFVVGALNAQLSNIVGSLQIALMGLVVVGVLVFNIRRGWRRWLASWLVYFLVIGTGLFSLAVDRLAPEIVSGGQFDVYLSIVLPLIIAYLLYKVTCSDRVGGLLAALPATMIIWTIFEEFVPALEISLAWSWSSLLAVAAAMMMMRAGRFQSALLPAAAAPVLGGAIFAYLGVYMGGTLPFTEPGPSLRETARQYLPFLAAVLSFTIGPQLAVTLRNAGCESAAAGGKVSYRFVLAGVLLLICTALFYQPFVTGEPALQTWMVLSKMRQVGLIGGAVLYLTGWVLLFIAIIRSDAFRGAADAGLRFAALFVLLPGVPFVLTFALDQHHSRRLPSPWNWIIFGLEMLWAAACLWLLHRERS